MELTNSNTEMINIIFLGGFDYPHGMAGTKRIQNTISCLKTYTSISIHVVIMRQSSRKNSLAGVYEGIPYETVMGDLFRMKMVLKAPLLFAKARQVVKRIYRPGQKNILYIYGPPSFDNLPTIRYARSIGYNIVFDIVEDDDLARDMLKNSLYRLKNLYICRVINQIGKIADGIVVISSHLEKKFRLLTSDTFPIHRLPISVDMDLYPEVRQRFGNPISILYSGSFDKKDGVTVLVDAFNRLASKRENVRLILTGAGADEDMRIVNQCVKNSPYKDRIIYKGYLNDADYYVTLRDADILCMPRIDIGFAQAGFPFKLGEYLATGKPVIASTVSDIPMLLKDRQEAMLVTPGSSDAIVEAAEFLINNPVIAFVIGAKGRARAKCLFDYHVHSKPLYGFLLGIVDRCFIHDIA